MTTNTFVFSPVKSQSIQFSLSSKNHSPSSAAKCYV